MLTDKKAASRQSTIFFRSTFHMHVIDVSMRACENFPAGKSAAKAAFWAHLVRCVFIYLGAHVFNMSASIRFVFSFSVSFIFGLPYVFSFICFPTVLCANDPQVVKFG